MRLGDFQILAQPDFDLEQAAIKAINTRLFAAFEPIRLWLREQRINAPFRKIAVVLVAPSSARLRRPVFNALGVCELSESTDLVLLEKHSRDVSWTFALIERALAQLDDTPHWRSDTLNALIRGFATQRPPLVHFFTRLGKKSRQTGEHCVPWLSFRPDRTELGVRIGTRDVVVCSKSGALYLEDEFPLARSKFKGAHFVLQDRDSNELASVPLVP